MLIDLGDFVPGMGKPAEIKLSLYTVALPYMRYDVVGVGELDVRLIKQMGKSAFEEAGIPQICANVVDATTKKPLLSKPYIIKKLPSGLRVAVIAVIGNVTLHGMLAKDLGVEVLPPEETVTKLVGKLQGKADLFVVLAHSGYQDAKKFAEKVKGIHVVLGSHPSPTPTDFERVGDTILMHCKGSSKYVGKLVLDIDADGKITSASGTLDLLSDKMGKDAEMEKLINDTEAAVTKYYQTSMSTPTGTTPQPGSQLSLENEPKPYVGAQRCIGCHLSIHQSWQKTKHAQAFEDLAKRDVNGKMNPDCISCHTTGYGSKGGFTTETETPYLRSVQCESCHGPGILHLRRPADKGYGAVSETTCRKCHDGANSPKFDYAKYREKILHPKK